MLLQSSTRLNNKVVSEQTSSFQPSPVFPSKPMVLKRSLRLLNKSSHAKLPESQFSLQSVKSERKNIGFSRKIETACGIIHGGEKSFLKVTQPAANSQFFLTPVWQTLKASGFQTVNTKLLLGHPQKIQAS